MLFGYPPKATRGNWLHRCVISALARIHKDVSAGTNQPNWPGIMPNRYRDRLRARTGLRTRLNEYRSAFELLAQPDRDSVHIALFSQNNLTSLFSGSTNCKPIADLPTGIQEPAKDLFKYCFEKLTDLGIRDSQYQTIFVDYSLKLCPFCGYEFFDAPGAPRPNLDHYLPESKYPYAGANLWNLIPMGPRCNQAYKHAGDILWLNGVRRRAFNPYDHAGTSISLLNSTPFGGNDHQYPNWVIDFSPASNEAETWDQMFQVRIRYVRDVLDQYYKAWLDDFGAWCKQSAWTVGTTVELIDALSKYSKYLEALGFNDRAFIKRAVVEMLLAHCTANNDRLVQLLIGVANQ